MAPAARPGWTAGCGQDDQGGGEQPGIAGPGRRIIGVQFYQPCYLILGVPHQRQDREHLMADPRHGCQPVMTAGQVSSLVRQDRIQLAGIERLHGAGGQDHRGLQAGDAVGSGLGMLHGYGPESGLGLADQPRGLRVPQRLPPGGAEMGHRGERGPDGDSAPRVRPSPATVAPPGVP